MIGTIIALVIMVCYLGWYVVNYGIPPSISQTVFKLPSACIFTLIIFSVGFLTIPAMIDRCSEGTQFLAFLTIFGVLLVGAAPLGKNCDEAVHFAGAIIFGLCSPLMIFHNSSWLLWIWLPTLAVVSLQDWRKWLFWIEIACIADLLVFCLFG